MTKYLVAIDGPAASGKSTAAKLLAARLGFTRINSGNLYRAITLLIFENFKEPDFTCLELKHFVEAIELDINGENIFYSGSDITPKLRYTFIDQNVNVVAKHLFIREKILKLQRTFINKVDKGVVVDGRDIGTVVLPNADLKIFLTAKEATRAMRRQKELLNSFDDVLREIRKRDYEDQNREHGRLKIAEDAIVISNDNMDLNATVDLMLCHFKKKVE